MKKSVTLLTLFFLLIITIAISCHKDTHNLADSRQFNCMEEIQRSQQWLKEARVNVTGQEALALDSVINLIDWKQSIIQQSGSTTMLVAGYKGTVSTLSAKSVPQPLPDGIKQAARTIFLFNSGGKISFAGIITMDSSGLTSGADPAQTIANIFRNREQGYSGRFDCFNMVKKPLFSLVYDKGLLKQYSRTADAAGLQAIMKSGKSQQNTPEKNTPPSDQGTVVDMLAHCTAWYWVTTYYFADGSTETQEQYAGMTCSNLYGRVPDGGGGGSSPAPNGHRIVKVDSVITSALSAYPCLQKAVNLIGNDNFKNYIVDMYQHFYAGAGATLNLQFIPSSTLVNDDGSPAVALSLPPDQNGSWTVRLNPVYTSSASQEFIAAAAMHEVLHSFVVIYLLGHPEIKIKSQVQQHEFMIQNFSDDLISFLQNDLHLSRQDAVALAFSGYGDLWSIPADSTMMASFGLTKEQIISISNAYFHGESGSICK